MARDYALPCPVCGLTIRQNHRCRGHADRPLEGQAAVEAARRVKAVLADVKAGRVPTGAPTDPQQQAMRFDSGGI